MKNHKPTYTNNEIILPRNACSLQISTINDIFFTNREIDVIACILNGRSIKKIAVLLSISPKTAETHIRNIMLKVGQRSQERIIDFIEKSDKYSLLKKHYLNLLTQIIFENELKNIQTIIGKSKTACIVNHQNGDDENARLMAQISADLMLAGVTIVSNVVQHSPTIILLLNKESIATFSKTSSISISIALESYENYYFFILGILEGLLPSISINKNILKFRNKTKNLIYHSSQLFQEEQTNVEQDISPHLNVKSKYSYPKARVLGLSIGLLIICSFSIYLIDYNTKTKNLTWNLPRQDHKFIGRVDAFEELHAKLHPKSSLPSFSAISVCAGLGGVGKTQLALQYARHAKHSYSLRAWFLAENIDQLKQQYMEFAITQGFNDPTPSFEKVLSYVKKWLAKNPGWLLVYDNANNYEDIKDFLPEAGGSIILTTRQQNWPTSFTKMDINIMDEKEAMELVQSFIPAKITAIEQEDLKELVKTLDYLPLALSQASAYMRQSSLSFTNYLKLYKEHEQELLIDNTLPTGTNSLPVATTWDISLSTMLKEEKTKNQPPLVLELLNVLAYLAPEKISQQLLLQWLKERHPELSKPELLLPKVIAQLSEYSLISKDTNNSITIHRLIQTVMRYKHKRTLTQKWLNLLLKSVHIAYISKLRTLEIEAQQDNLLPHLQSLLAHYKQTWPNTPEINLVPILNGIGEIFSLISEYRKAIPYHERALVALQLHYDKHHIEIARTMDYLGNAYRHLSLNKQAKEFHERSLKIKEAFYGKEHIEIAHTLDYLGRISRAFGDFKQAKEFHERAVKIKEICYGQNDVQVAITLDHLGQDYRNLLDIRKSKTILERSLLIKEKHYAKDNVIMAVTLDYLGRTYRYLGDVKQAKNFHERSVKIKEAYYGKEHVEVAYTLDQLGRDCRYLGEFKRAKEFHMRSTKIKTAHYGKDNIDVAFTIDYLGRVYRMSGDFGQARELHERALIIKEAYYGKDHIANSYAIDQLGRDYRALGDAKQAKELHTHVLKIKEQYYGKDTFEVALILDQLGQDYRALNDGAKAKELHERALKIKNFVYGDSHPETAATYANLGCAYLVLNNLTQATIYLKKALKIKEHYYGKNNIVLVEVLMALSDAYNATDNTMQQNRYSARALKIKRQYSREN